MADTRDSGKLGAEMRKALRHLAKAVVVITCRHDGQRFAMAATAVSEVSMAPPSLLICVNQAASLYRPLAAGADFCVNILHSTQEQISAVCSGKSKGEARFETGAWLDDAGLPPYLGDAQASFFCRQEMRVDYGTHGVFIGEVTRVVSSGIVDPLVYVDGRYTVVQPGTMPR